MKVLSQISLAILLSASFSLTAQDFSYPSLEVQEVSFEGPDLLIRLDDYSGVYSAPQYDISASEQQPVAYKAGDAPVVSAEFSMECDQAPDSVWIKGIATDSMVFPAQKVALYPAGATTYDLSYPSTFAASSFPSNTVQYYDSYEIDWQVSFDGTHFRSSTKSSNTMYVTRGTPMSETSRFKYFRSVYDISCRNAKGTGPDSTLIAAVWNEFVDHAVLSWDGDSLHYYETFNTSNTNLAALMKYKNAQCYTFAQLFLSLLKIQGLSRTNNYVYITPTTSYECGYSVNRFLVANWVFDTASSASFCPAYPYKNTYTTLLPPPYNEYNFIQEDVRDSTGLFGQGSDNPASYFNNHQISFIDGVYYDACYGVTFNSVADIPTKAFSGWGFRYSSSGVTNAFFTNDMSKTYLRTIVSTF